MDKEHLEAIKKRLRSDEDTDTAASSRGIGLVNISRRIKLKFGNKYGLLISSELNKGTVVTVVLPLKGADHV